MKNATNPSSMNTTLRASIIQVNTESFFMRAGPYLTTPDLGRIICLRTQYSTRASPPHTGRNIAEDQKSPINRLKYGATAHITTNEERKISTNPLSSAERYTWRSASLIEILFSLSVRLSSSTNPFSPGRLPPLPGRASRFAVSGIFCFDLSPAGSDSTLHRVHLPGDFLDSTCQKRTNVLFLKSIEPESKKDCRACANR